MKISTLQSADFFMAQIWHKNCNASNFSISLLAFYFPLSYLSSNFTRHKCLSCLIHLTRAEAGHLGDLKSVGNRISEMRNFVGTGYRLYFTIKGDAVIFMLCGGDKSSQQRDIEKAIEILPTLEDCEIDDENKDI